MTLFKDLTFCISGSLSMTRNEWVDLINKYGGKFSKAVTKSTDYLISTDAEFQSVTAKVDKAKSTDTPIVYEDFLLHSIAKKKMQDPEKYVIGGIKAKTKAKTKAPAKPAAKPATKTSKSNGKANSSTKTIFKDLTFCISGTLSSSTKAQFNTKIEKHGGSVAGTVNKSVTHLITTEFDVLKKTGKVKAAMDKSIPILKETFVLESIENGKLEKEDSYTFKDDDNNDDDDEEEEEEEEDKAKKRKADTDKTEAKKAKKEEEEEESVFVKTMVKKGKAAVDTNCPQSNVFHVYESNGCVYDAMLNQTNSGQNNNKFYVIQLLQKDAGNGFAVWTRWGRVGATGQSNLSACNDANAAITTFSKKFKDKTKNNWADRENFVFKKGSYDMLDIDYGDDDEEENEDESMNIEVKKEESKLDLPVQELVKLVCNVENMNNAVREMKYDTKKVPLGKLTKTQIQNGYSLLKTIETLINKYDAKSQAEIRDLSDRYYTKIPHSFGMSVPPSINTHLRLKEELGLMEALGDIQIAVSIIKESSKSSNVIDSQYDALKCKITPVSKKEKTFKIVDDYLQNTHGSTHSSYTLEIEDLFELEKEGESDRFKSVGNSQLLWHGSRLTNYVGILSQGLRIAPPEAPVTGYMFGKGVYFADMSSKSANYCFTSPTNNTGVLILSEVALGKPKELFRADYNANKLPSGYHSTWGKGRMQPDPKGCLELDNIKVPMGKGVSAPEPPGKENYSLQYNEFIVYDTAQVKMKYLLKCKFNYKKR